MSDSISSAAIMDTLRDQLSQINATVDHQEASSSPRSATASRT